MRVHTLIHSLFVKSHMRDMGIFTNLEIGNHGQLLRVHGGEFGHAIARGLCGAEVRGHLELWARVWDGDGGEERVSVGWVDKECW